MSASLLLCWNGRAKLRLKIDRQTLSIRAFKEMTRKFSTFDGCLGRLVKRIWPACCSSSLDQVAHQLEGLRSWLIPMER